MAQRKNTPQASVPKPDKANEQGVPPGTTVDVSAPRPRRRGGMRFGKQPVTVDPAKVGEEAWEAIVNDLVLVIRPTPDDRE